MSQGCTWPGNRWNTIETVADFYDFLFYRAKVYTIETVEHLLIAFLSYSVLCCLLYLGIVRWHVIQFEKQPKPKRVLLVIAHPDDECMFFGPTVLNLTRNNDCTMYLLCLSTGVNYGMGKVRKNELYEACKVLGINDNCVLIQNHTLMPDDMTIKWPSELVSQIILHQVETYNIDTVITFDKEGVSNHVNHCSIYYAVAHLCMEGKLPKYCSVLLLESINNIRKYWLFLDIPLCFLLSSHRYIITCWDRSILAKAMTEHKSQYVWFRKLYMFFSRYTCINTFQELNIVDVEFDLETDDL